MKKIITKVFVIFSACLIISPVFAEQISVAAARKNISKHFPKVSIKDITLSPIPGLYQVVALPNYFYVSADGRYVVDGDLFDMASRKNISQTGRNKSNAIAIAAMAEDSMIIFGKKTLKHTVTVFTDIDCGYCRKLHNEVKEYNKLGIRVRYLAYPRAGVGSDSFKKAEAVWCSKDKAKALTDSKNGVDVKLEKCNSPIEKHFALGEAVGVRGTPAIFLADGSILPGYIPAARLSAILNQADK